MQDQYPRITSLNNLPEQFLLASIGSNTIKKLANKFGLSKATIEPFFVACTFDGWRRMFFGSSTKWDSSVATVERSVDSTVNCIAVQILRNVLTFKIGNNVINFQALASSEAFPNKYVLRRLGNCNGLGSYSGLDAWAFVRNPGYTFEVTKTVSDAYMKAVCRMLRDRRRLLGHDLATDYKIDKVYYRPNGTVSVKDTVTFGSREI